MQSILGDQKQSVKFRKVKNMHDYLQAIGFDQSMNHLEKKSLMKNIIEVPDEKIYFQKNEDVCIIQYNKNYGESFGISIVGEINRNGDYTLEYMYPYVNANNSFYYEDIYIEKFADRDAYAGICEDINPGVPLIFYVHNFLHYLNMSQYKEMFPEVNHVSFAGLSLEGTVILNVEKDEFQIKKEEKINYHRSKLFEAAKEGDMQAIEILTIDDMDAYNIVSKRVKSEDVFTIVDSYCIPHGIETDKYSILGTIYGVKEIKNHRTGKIIYHLTVKCNNIELDLCINRDNLLGEPLIGRRFKGIVWMQGVVDYI